MVPFNPLDWFRGSGAQAKCRTALSGCASLEEATKDVTNQLGSEKGDLALVFESSQFASDLPRLLPLLSQRLQAEHWIGFVGGGVVGTDSAGRSQELEQTTALSITLLNLPGAQLKPFQLDTGSLPDLDGPVQNWQDWVSVDPADSRSLLLFIDPSCGAINALISGLDYAYPNAAIIGGIAAPHNASHGSLLFDGQIINGAAGVSSGVDWVLDPVVAQAWRNYDINILLQRRWKQLEPKLRGKLHLSMGELDTFYLEGAVVQMMKTLETLKRDAKVEILEGKNHGNVRTAALVKRHRLQMWLLASYR